MASTSRSRLQRKLADKRQKEEAIIKTKMKGIQPEVDFNKPDPLIAISLLDSTVPYQVSGNPTIQELLESRAFRQFLKYPLASSHVDEQDLDWKNLVINPNVSPSINVDSWFDGAQKSGLVPQIGIPVQGKSGRDELCVTVNQVQQENVALKKLTELSMSSSIKEIVSTKPDIGLVDNDVQKQFQEMTNMIKAMQITLENERTARQIENKSMQDALEKERLARQTMQDALEKECLARQTMQTELQKEIKSLQLYVKQAQNVALRYLVEVQREIYLKENPRQDNENHAMHIRRVENTFESDSFAKWVFTVYQELSEEIHQPHSTSLIIDAIFRLKEGRTRDNFFILFEKIYG